MSCPNTGQIIMAYFMTNPVIEFSAEWIWVLTSIFLFCFVLLLLLSLFWGFFSGVLFCFACFALFWCREKKDSITAVTNLRETAGRTWNPNSSSIPAKMPPQQDRVRGRGNAGAATLDPGELVL